MTLIDEKRTLRSAMLAWRGGLNEEQRRAAADGLLVTMRRERPIATPSVVSGFWPIKEEIDIRPLMIELFNQGCQMALPVVLLFLGFLFAFAGEADPYRYDTFEGVVDGRRFRVADVDRQQPVATFGLTQEQHRRVRGNFDPHADQLQRDHARHCTRAGRAPRRRVQCPP